MFKVDFFGNALQSASYHVYEEVVKLLFEEGADVHAQVGFFGNKEVAKLLVQKGANVHTQSGDFSNALQVVSSNGHEKVAQPLVEHGAKYVTE